MKITGHLTLEVFGRYNLGNVDVLRERLTRSRDYVCGLRAKSKVTPLRQPATSAERRLVRAPGHVEHRFRRKPNTHSDASRTPIPGRSNTLSGRR